MPPHWTLAVCGRYYCYVIPLGKASQCFLHEQEQLGHYATDCITISSANILPAPSKAETTLVPAIWADPTEASHQRVALSKEEQVSKRSLQHTSAWVSLDRLAADLQGRALAAAGHSGFEQGAEECTVSVCCTNRGRPGQCNKNTQSGSDCFGALLQNPDPFTNGQISGVLSKVPTPFRILSAFLCDLHPCYEVYLGICGFKVISVTHMMAAWFAQVCLHRCLGCGEGWSKKACTVWANFTLSWHTWHL